MSTTTASGSQGEDLTPPKRHNSGTKWRVIEVAVLALAIVAVWGLLFLLPIVFSYVPLLQVRCSFQCSISEQFLLA